MKTKQIQDMWTERKDQEEMKTMRKKHQGIRIGKKRQLAVLKPLKCRYCPWRFFSNIARYLSHAHNHATRINSYWYKNAGLYHPQAASEAVVQLRAICTPSYMKPNKPEVQYMENKCRFCGRYFTRVHAKKLHEKSVHLCHFCEKTFENAKMKRNHELKCGCMDKERNKCRFCSKYFETVHRKTLHEEYEHLTCNFCDKAFENAEVKTNHELECKCMGKTKCRFCSRYFTTVNGRAKHEKYEHICDICAETFENVLDKKLHKLEYHSTDENKCHFCSQSFPTAYYKTLHVKSEHLCDICEKPFKNAAAKKVHKVVVHNMKVNNLYECNFCHRSFTTGRGHSHHVKSEHLCNFCDKTFENAEMKTNHQLEYHAKKAGTKDIKCHFCTRYFPTAIGRTIHETYEHICDFKSCEETFQNAEDKKIHKFECHGVEANFYRCRFCKKYFTKAIQKTMHEKCEHICQFCLKTFKNADGKKSHEWSHFRINHCHEFENHCTKTTGKCRDCGNYLTPAHLLLYPYTQLYTCLFCKKIIRLPEVKRCQETAHNEQSSSSIKSTNQ